MKIIGITGSSGSGKSLATKILSEQLQAKIINADQVVKQMQEKDSEYYRKIVELFGINVVQEDSSLNRRKIAEIIFQDRVKKERLDELTFEYVVEEIRQQVEKAKEEYIIIDAPLLIESKLNDICNIVIAIISEKEE